MEGKIENRILDCEQQNIKKAHNPYIKYRPDIKVKHSELSYNDNHKDEELISLYTQQISGLRAEYISIQSSFLTMTAISFGGYGLILYYAFKLDTEISDHSINYLYLALPFLFGISFINILKYSIKALGIGAYITHLEKKINSILNKNIYIWHSKLAYLNGYNVVGIAHFFCNLALYILIAKRFDETMTMLRDDYLCTYILLVICLVLMILIILFSLIVCATQYDAVKLHCEEVFNSGIDFIDHKSHLTKFSIIKYIIKKYFVGNTNSQSKENNQ